MQYFVWWRQPRQIRLQQSAFRSFCERLGERRYLQSPTYKVLKRLEVAQKDAVEKSGGGEVPVTWLVSHRDDLRYVFADFHPDFNEGQASVLRRYMATCPDAMYPLCVWLLGKCADRFRLYGLASLWDDPSPQVRRQVAKSLRRAEAWKLLERMARRYRDDDRIRWFASTPPRHRPFRERLTSFVQSVDDSHADEVATPSRMPYWSADRTWEYTPPKSRDLIRRMLRRIRHWVRWGAT
jgi:hypothetical protein